MLVPRMGVDLIARWMARLRPPASHEPSSGPATPASRTPLVWTRLVSAPGRPGGEVRRAARLTPYVAQTIVEDALRGGRGTRLEMTVVSRVGVAGLAQLRDQFSWLADRGIDVTVRRGRGPSPLGEPPAHP